MSIEVALGESLKAKGWTLAVAETTTGGLISARIVGVPGSSAYFERGVVAYSKESKVEMLGISEDHLSEFGAVSEETAVALAEGVRKLSGTTLGIAETGIAGPILGRSPKPLGSTYIAIAAPDGTRCEEHVFQGNRDTIRQQIACRALELVLETLDN